MPWILFAVIVWFVMLMIFRKGDLKTFWSVGPWSFVVFFFLNEAFVTRGIYSFNELFFAVEDIPLAYLLAVTGLGIIVIRYLPEEKWWQLPYLILFAVIFSILEYFALKQGYIIYLDWSLYYTFLFKLLTLIAIAWLSNLTVHKPTEYIFR